MKVDIIKGKDLTKQLRQCINRFSTVEMENPMWMALALRTLIYAELERRGGDA